MAMENVMFSIKVCKIITFTEFNSTIARLCISEQCKS